MKYPVNNLRLSFQSPFGVQRQSRKVDIAWFRETPEVIDGKETGRLITTIIFTSDRKKNDT